MAVPLTVLTVIGWSVWWYTERQRFKERMEKVLEDASDLDLRNASKLKFSKKWSLASQP